MTTKQSSGHPKKTARSAKTETPKPATKSRRDSNHDMDKTLAFRLPTEEIAALKGYAERMGLSVSQVIRSFLPTDFVAKNEYIEEVKFVHGISARPQSRAPGWKVVKSDGTAISRNMKKLDAIIHGQWLASTGISA